MQKKYIGANKDWLLTSNMCDLSMSVRKLDNVIMTIFEGLNGKPCELSIHMNPYLHHKTVTLHFTDFESACNEADDVYREILTKAIEYLTKQIRLLPDI